MTSKIGSKAFKGIILQAELCKVINSIRVQGVTKNYGKEFFQLYFESHKQSGGGQVTSIQLLGNGEAIVTFQDPRGMLFGNTYHISMLLSILISILSHHPVFDCLIGATLSEPHTSVVHRPTDRPMVSVPFTGY